MRSEIRLAGEARRAGSNVGSEGVRLGSIDTMRGLAALAVCWFHLTGSAGPVSAPFRASGAYGWLGVDVFFVISGFILPYSLSRSRYTVASVGRFVAKRVIRLDPPYFVSIVLGLAVAWLVARAPGSNAVFTAPDPARLLLHAGYAIPFDTAGRHEWLSPVYWTLAIEFQFYLLLAFAYPLVAHGRDSVAAITCATLIATGFLLPTRDFFPHHAPLFVLGIYCFRLKAERGTRSAAAAGIVAALAICCWELGLPQTIAGGAAVLVILSGARLRVPFGAYLGTISYSLYLVHWDVGRVAVALARHVPGLGGADVWTRGVGLAASIVAASALYRLVEAPSRDLAARIAYPRRVSAAEVEAVVTS